MATSVQGLVAVVINGIHTKCANTHAVDCLFAHIDVKPGVVSLVPPVTENVAEDALMLCVLITVRSRVIRVNNPVRGVALITSVIVFVEKTATGLAVMLPARKNYLAATRASAYAVKTVLLSVPFVIPKSSLLC